MRRRRWLPLSAFAALAAVLAVGLQSNPREPRSSFIGRPAPAFTLPLLHDPGRSLSPAEFKGRVWVLNVWASWCAPCRAEHPLLVEAARAGQVTLVGLNTRDDPRNAQEWLHSLGDPYVAVAADGDGRVAVDYGVHGVPETFVIDQGGIVRLKHIGPLTGEVWSRKVLPLVRSLQG